VEVVEHMAGCAGLGGSAGAAVSAAGTRSSSSSACSSPLGDNAYPDKSTAGALLPLKYGLFLHYSWHRSK